MITIPTPPANTFGTYKVAPPKKSIWPYFAVIFIVIALAAAGYYILFYKKISLSFNAPSVVPAPPLTQMEEKLIKIPKFPLEVLDSDFYKSLKIYGTLPVVADSLGRTNPFIPY